MQAFFSSDFTSKLHAIMASANFQTRKKRRTAVEKEQAVRNKENVVAKRRRRDTDTKTLTFRHKCLRQEQIK